MKRTYKMKQWIQHSALVAAASAVALTGCGKNDSSSSSSGSGSSTAAKVIQVQGSDTMVNLAQAWAETYGPKHTEVSVEVGGGGSGVGIAALINGTIDIASASRDMKEGEREKAKANSGKEAKEFTVGYDALAVYVHKDNPLSEVTMEQLKNIFAEGGTITKWSQIGITIPGCDSDEIVRVSRQSSSGTFAFFREHVLENIDFRQGSVDMNGSKEVVEMVTHTPCAIGYSGMGYATPEVKMLKVAKATGETAYAPSVKNTVDKSYPIARPLFLYTLGDPQGATKDYIDWILGPEGQHIVEESGYVPVGSSK